MMEGHIRSVSRGCSHFYTNSSKLNDIVYKRPTIIENLLIYFGGDVQNIEVEMIKTKEYRKYIEYSLEGIVSKLAADLPTSLVMAVKPCRMENETFSCYDNFVESNDFGAPTHNQKDPKFGAMRHLHDLLSQFGAHINEPITTLPMKIVGFSKGVVVLNQLLFDWHTLSSTVSNNEEEEIELMKKFFLQTEKISWLDGGHNGGKSTWICDEFVLSSLINKTKILIDIRVTPYQIRDKYRPWIMQEELKFFSCINEECNLNKDLFRIHRKIYFQDEKKSLLNHFKILETLCDDPKL